MEPRDREIIDITEWSDFKKSIIICESGNYWCDEDEEDEDEDYMDHEAQDELIEFWEEQWNNVHSEIVYVDTEKAYYDTRVVLKRVEDGKFFECNWMFSYYHKPYNALTELREVFPEPSIKYI